MRDFDRPVAPYLAVEFASSQSRCKRRAVRETLNPGNFFEIALIREHRLDLCHETFRTEQNLARELLPVGDLP